METSTQLFMTLSCMKSNSSPYQQMSFHWAKWGVTAHVRIRQITRCRKDLKL